MIKTLLEFGPILAFFVAYLWLKDDVFTIGGREYDGFIVVTAGFIPVFLLAMGALWWLTGHLSKMQVVTAVLIVVFGGMSVWFNDPRFFKMKPTIIYLLFGGVLGVGLLRGQSYMQSLMDGVMPLSDEGWIILTKRICFFLPWPCGAERARLAHHERGNMGLFQDLWPDGGDLPVLHDTRRVVP